MTKFYKITLIFALMATMSVFTVQTSTIAQSIVLRLPKDGTWATYEQHSKTEMVTATTYKSTGEITVRCVGTIHKDMDSFRWIEFDHSYDMKGQRRRSIYKVLVPEKQFGEDKNPIEHIEKAWVANYVGDLVQPPVELEPESFAMSHLYGYLTPPLENKKSVKSKEFEIGDKKLECTGISGFVHTETVIHRQSKQAQKREYTVYRHESSPFLAVFIDYQTETSFDGQLAGKTIGTLKLKKFGTGAESALLDHQE
jgi:hypothetical protein